MLTRIERERREETGETGGRETETETRRDRERQRDRER